MPKELHLEPQTCGSSLPLRLSALLGCMAVVASAGATVSADVEFESIVTQLVSWIQGSLGGVIKIASLLIGVSLAIKTQRLPIPISVTLVTFYVPEVVESIFGAVV